MFSKKLRCSEVGFYIKVLDDEPRPRTDGSVSFEETNVVIGKVYILMDGKQAMTL